MTQPPMISAIERIHAAFCAATGVQLRLGLCEFGRERAWHDYLQAGFTEADMLMVVNYLKKEIHKGTRNPGAIKFSNTIMQLDRFEEDLGLAKAGLRNSKPPMTPKAQVLQQARPVVCEQVSPESTAKPIAEYINQLRKAVSENL